MDGTAGVNEG